jgi:hypothetical protein
MKSLIGRCLLLLSFAFFVSSSRAEDPIDDSNLIWQAKRAEVVASILTTARGFDALFANASQSEVSPEIVEIVLRTDPYTDKDGKSYQPSILVADQDNAVVLTLMDLTAGTPDLTADNLGTRLFKAIITALDAKFKRAE